MSKQPETQADRLARTSEIYRRMHAEVQPPLLSGQATVEPAPMAQPDPPPSTTFRPVAAPRVAPLPAAPLAAEPGFVHRLLTRRPDRRELILLGVVAIAVLYSIHPF